MKITAKIEKLIKQRENLAIKLKEVDNELSNFIDKYDIELESFDYRLGVESLINPESLADRVREAMLEKPYHK